MSERAESKSARNELSFDVSGGRFNVSKDALKKAPGFKYDSTKTTWVPDKSSQ